ncbi:HAMP domain-containing sensor histidine kinase, partial [Clostridium sp.]|uniref:HAMP domain-containing sensor histidine kinase n=1 Tax=Clostridium sp. TaxID=1506 RepID=UPI003F2E941C
DGLFKTIKGKILFYTILAVVSINIVFTAFITYSLNKTFKTDIINEMSKVKEVSLSTIKRNKVVEEPLWKTLKSIKEISNSYVSIANNEDVIFQFTGNQLDEGEIKNILSESNKNSSIIKFKNLGKVYCITYNYPVYLNDEFYGNLIIQKDYTEKYNEMVNLIGVVITGQVLGVIAIILVVSVIVNKIINPLKSLNKSMELFTLGEDVEDININSKDELEELSKSYNIMRRQIKDQIDVIVYEKEKVEKLQKSSREFFNNATHELKTPITSISLYSQALRDNEIKDMDEEFISRATSRMALECDKMKDLVEKILQVSKGEVINKSKSNFSLTFLVYEVLEEFKVKISNRNLNVHIEMDEVEIYLVKEDIKQVIENLLDNSIKYNKGNYIDIKLKKDNNKIIFEIKNKCGDFPDELKDRLLEPFLKYNIYKDMSKEISSSGLGLYLCSELVKENGGGVSYIINENQITFIVEIIEQ